jgi:hypothetical protein
MTFDRKLLVALCSSKYVVFMANNDLWAKTKTSFEEVSRKIQTGGV